MIKKPFRNFLIALFLFLVFFIGGSFIPEIYELLKPKHDWIFTVGSFFSLAFALLSVVGLIRNYRRDKTVKLFNIIAFVGNFGIIIYLTFMLIVLLIILVGGFPVMD